MVAKRKLLLEEHVESIIAAGGPKGALKKRYQYKDLAEILQQIHTRKELLDLQPYHFKSVFNIWEENGVKNYDLAREATGELVDILKDQYNWTDENVIEKIGHHHFLNRKIKYGAKISGMLQLVYDDSPASAVIDYYHNHHDEEVRKKFKDLKHYHFSNIRNIWNKKDGTKNYELGREAMEELVGIMKQRYGWTEEQVFASLTQRRFHKEKIKYGVTLCGMLERVYDDSLQKAVRDYVTHRSAA